MPPVSQAQRRWAYWVLNNSRSKKLKKVAKDFVGHGVTDLPEKVEDGKAVEKALRLTAHQPKPVQAGARSQVAPNWHHEGTAANPMNERQRVVRNGGAMGVYQLDEDPVRLNHFHVNDVRAVTRGGGRAAMEHLTQMADHHGVSLQLVAEPLNPRGGEGKKLTRRELRSWYHGFGFRPKQGDLMVRTPTKLEKSMRLTPPFRALAEQLEKSWFMERKVRFGSPTRDVNDGRLTTTAMADGTTRKVTTGPVRASRVPDPKKKPGALKKEVREVVAPDYMTNRFGETMLSPSASLYAGRPGTKSVPKDTDTTKYTAMRDGSVQAIRLFAKALAARLRTI